MSIEWQGTVAVLLFAVVGGFLFEYYLRYRDNRRRKDVEDIMREIREETAKHKRNRS